MIVGCARTSSLSQVAGLEAQERDLRGAGCERVFSEQVSSVAQREQLGQALDYVREGDWFCVTKLDRLARSWKAVDEAIAHYRKALAIRPDYADASCNLASALLSNGDLDGAIAHYSACLALSPEGAERYRSRVLDGLTPEGAAD